MPGNAFLTFDCETCAQREHVSMDDAEALVEGARSFFVSHRACRTVIDLSSTRYEGWRVP